MKRVPFTKEGLAKITSEYEQLLSQRPAAVADLKSAREKGDLSENSAYRAARWKLSSIDSRLRKLKKILDAAYVVENINPDTVDIGTYVSVENEDKITQTFRIVNTFESDLSRNLISSFSPLGKALMGKKVADSVSVSTPEGTKKYRILGLSVSSL